MPIEIVCDDCGAELKLKDSMAGKSGTCPVCKSMLDVDELRVRADSQVQDIPFHLPSDLEKQASSILCPYCNEPLRDDVAMNGQMVVCPGCNAQVQMPNNAPLANVSVFLNVVVAVFSVIAAMLLMTRGCVLLDLADAL